MLSETEAYERIDAGCLLSQGSLFQFLFKIFFMFLDSLPLAYTRRLNIVPCAVQ